MIPLNIPHAMSGNMTMMSKSGLLTMEMYQKLLYLFGGMSISVATLGTVGNIMTIIVYFKMGFSETTTISLTALAISDLGIALTAITTGLFFTLPFPFLQPLAPETTHTINSYPHLAFTRVSAMITTFVSVERYFCVFWPLKIKSIITPRRTVKAMLVILALSFLPMVVLYLKYPLGWKYFAEVDTVLIGLLPSDDPTIVLIFQIFRAYYSTVLPIVTFFTVTVSTILLTISLSKSRQWRDKNRSTATGVAASEKSAPTSGSTKETKAMKMVVVVATVFIISSIPSCIHIIVRMTIPGFEITGKYSDLFAVTGLSFFTVDCLNCSANIIIYFNMSTKFRQAFLELFSLRRRKLMAKT